MADGVAALEARAAAAQQRHAVQALVDVQAGELFIGARREELRQVLLVFRQHVDRVVFAGFEHRQALEVARQAPDDQRRVERNGVERIDRQPDRLAVRRPGRDHRDAGGEHAERVAERAGEFLVGDGRLGHGQRPGGGSQVFACRA
ncbi:hypothetical protein ebA2697 [Aromatoleum aromaticum EbN1]|uniref:Uncharacterized protein n=1 Tax=Aromatoleum aromaticum (strain DSM 19018 / LMG 30748 / EbN1) TaxID=76114 RepID=Q5P4X1_AROAE|nr:hypothetical protein ebA2697 [Aromatoleum aromaticum EbN1]